MALDITSLPVPVSPNTNTGSSDVAKTLALLIRSLILIDFAAIFSRGLGALGSLTALLATPFAADLTYSFAKSTGIFGLMIGVFSEDCTNSTLDLALPKITAMAIMAGVPEVKLMVSLSLSLESLFIHIAD